MTANTDKSDQKCCTDDLEIVEIIRGKNSGKPRILTVKIPKKYITESDYIELKKTQGKDAGESWKVPESRVISIRIPAEIEVGTIIRVFAEAKK